MNWEKWRLEVREKETRIGRNKKVQVVETETGSGRKVRLEEGETEFRGEKTKTRRDSNLN